MGEAGYRQTICFLKNLFKKNKKKNDSSTEETECLAGFFNAECRMLNYYGVKISALSF
jgi:hypothetical protein